MNYYTRRDLNPGGTSPVSDPSTDPRAVHCFGFQAERIFIKADSGNGGPVMFSFDRQQSAGLAVGVNADVITHGRLEPGESAALDITRGHVITWIDPASPPTVAVVEVSAFAV